MSTQNSTPRGFELAANPMSYLMISTFFQNPSHNVVFSLFLFSYTQTKIQIHTHMPILCLLFIYFALLAFSLDKTTFV